jgi:transglutaminase-like putative cysteine protease
LSRTLKLILAAVLLLAIAAGWWVVYLVRLRPVEAVPLSFDESDREVISRSWSAYSDEYLEQLRTGFRLDALVNDCETDYQRVRAVANWVHNRWEHDSSNQPAQSDPIFILREAAKGQRFRCVEYGIVIAGCLQALGIEARTLELKTRDCETRASGAGHVAAEAYLPELGKWVFIDGQANAIPELDGIPLNAVEFQQALARKEPALTLPGLSPADAEAYQRGVAQYLYYFEVSAGGEHIMLGPLGARQPTAFQRKHSIDVTKYTHSVKAFYAAPK